MPSNPLLSDAFVDFLVTDVLDATALCQLKAFENHSGETFGPWLSACRRLAREVLWPAYRPMDSDAPRFVDGGRIVAHPRMKTLWRELVSLGVISAGRAGHDGLPLTVLTLSSAYLMAANLSAYGYCGLTTGAAHLIDAFGTPALRENFAERMYAGEWSGTMALTEPQAGSSLADVTTRATRAGDSFRLTGAKLFISGGDQDFTENVVHLVLARIEGALAGTRGLSLFAVPKLRRSGETLVPNDVHVTGMIHKLGWRGLPSLALSFGDEGDCHGWLVGAENAGLKHMFQMMNEARIMVGLNAAATASVAFHESLAWARERKQGRPLGVSDASTAQVALIEHPDVRRMLLRQKAIVEGSLCLLGVTARYADLSEHSADADERATAKLLLDLLTPIAKTFAAEKGFEANALALQLHGGYGYSSEYLPEAWLRDQKLNSIHEGTTTIQGLDLLGRKVVAGGGAALAALTQAIEADLSQDDATGVRRALERVTAVTATLGARGLEGDVLGMLGHSADYLEALSVLVVSWMWVKLVKAAQPRTDDFAKGLRSAASYWLATELPRVEHLLSLCESRESSYLDVDGAWL